MSPLEPIRKVSREKYCCCTVATNDFHMDDQDLAGAVAVVVREPEVHRRAVSEVLARSRYSGAAAHQPSCSQRCWWFGKRLDCTVDDLGSSCCLH